MTPDLKQQVAFQSACTKYEEAKCAMKKKLKCEEENLTNQLGIQINQLKSKVAYIIKILNFLDEEFTECVFSAKNKSPTEQSQVDSKSYCSKM